MSEARTYVIHTDGAARGNPGPAAYAYIIETDGTRPIEKAECIGQATNNVAEYTALVRALEHAVTLGAKRLEIRSDSELLVKQMNGHYKVKNADLKEFYDQAKDLCRRFDSVTIVHIPREENRRADRLGNAALDRQRLSNGVKPGANVATATPSPREDALREEAVLCLETAAKAWARGNAADPPADAVWDQLWTLLEDSGVLKSARTR